MYIDSHCHLYFDRFDEDRGEVIERARAAGFLHVMNIGIDVPTSQAAVALADEYPGFCYASVGLHPTDTEVEESELASILAQLEAIADENPAAVRAWGEIGMDYYWDKATPEKQDRAFRAQLDIAVRRDLPVIIHCRDAMEDTLAVVAEYRDKVRGVFHCFCGNGEDARRAVELGWHVSFAGNVTFPKAGDLREAALATPPDRMLLETDAPFLAPQPVRGKRNEPVHSLHTLEALAKLHEMDSEELGKITTRNTQALFGIASQV